MSSILNWLLETHNEMVEVIKSLPEKMVPQEMIYPFGNKGDIIHLIEHMMEHEEGHIKDIKEYFNSRN